MADIGPVYIVICAGFVDDVRISALIISPIKISILNARFKPPPAMKFLGTVFPHIRDVTIKRHERSSVNTQPASAEPRISVVIVRYVKPIKHCFVVYEEVDTFRREVLTL